MFSKLYVGLQVRQSNSQARQRDEMERAESHRAQSRDGNALFTKDGQGQLDSWLMMYTIHVESVEFVQEGGSIDTSLAERRHIFLVSLVKFPGGALWWATTKSRFQPAFVDQIERMTGRADSPPALTEATQWFSSDSPTSQES